MKIKLLSIVLLSCLLQACVPAAIAVVGATAGGAIIYDHRSVNTMARDRDTTFEAGRKLAADPDLKQAHIVVATFNHVALLTGQAPTPELSQRAYDIVSSLPNIKRIYNEITIAPPTSEWRRSHDAWITTKVKAAMLAQKGLRSSLIKVVTENSVVYLMGMVRHTQGNLAADVASKVKDVRTVVKLFEYLN